MNNNTTSVNVKYNKGMKRNLQQIQELLPTWPSWTQVPLVEEAVAVGLYMYWSWAAEQTKEVVVVVPYFLHRPNSPSMQVGPPLALHMCRKWHRCVAVLKCHEHALAVEAEWLERKDNSPQEEEAQQLEAVQKDPTTKHWEGGMAQSLCCSGPSGAIDTMKLIVGRLQAHSLPQETVGMQWGHVERRRVSSAAQY